MANKIIQIIPPGYTDVYYPQTTASAVIEETNKKFVTSTEKNLLTNFDSKVTNNESVLISAVMRHDHYLFTAIVTTNWVGNDAPYTQSINVDGIYETPIPLVSVIYSLDQATRILEEEAWSKISEVEITNNTILLTCFHEKPTQAFNIQVVGIPASSLELL